MRFCHPWNRWLVWDRKRWAVDQTGSALRLAKRVAERLVDEAAAEVREPVPACSEDCANRDGPRRFRSNS
jgi:hypothetical protein